MSDDSTRRASLDTRAQDPTPFDASLTTRAGTVSQPLLCPVMVGRNATVDVLQCTLDLAGGGQGRVVLISGEAGVGKSRLAAEGRAYAEQRFVVLASACFLQDRASPYAPVLELLRARFAGLDPDAIAEVVGPFGREISWLLPDLATSPADGSSASNDPEQQRGRLFTALMHVLLGQARERSVLIFVDDLQWADDASLDVLLHLARRAVGSVE